MKSKEKKVGEDWVVVDGSLVGEGLVQYVRASPLPARSTTL